MKFGTNGVSRGYLVPVKFVANGGGANVNKWTIIMDLSFPAGSAGKRRALVQTDPANPAGDDAEFYINESNALGTADNFRGNIPADTWVRLAFVADLSANPGVVKTFINGVKAGE